MDQHASHDNIDSDQVTLKSHLDIERSDASDFATHIFNTHIRLVYHWLGKLIAHESLASIDTELLASIIVEELLLRLLALPNGEEKPPL